MAGAAAHECVHPGRDVVSIHRGRVGWCGRPRGTRRSRTPRCPFIGAALAGAADTTTWVISWDSVSIHRGRVGWCGAAMARRATLRRTRCPFIGAALAGAAGRCHGSRLATVGCPFIGAALAGAAARVGSNDAAPKRCPFIGAALAGAATNPDRHWPMGAVSIHRGRVGWCGKADPAHGLVKLVCPFIGAALAGAAGGASQICSRRRPVSIHRGRVGWCGTDRLPTCSTGKTVSIHRGRVGWCGTLWPAETSSHTRVHSSGPRWLVRQKWARWGSKKAARCPFIGAALAGAARDGRARGPALSCVHSSGPRWLVRRG